MITNTTAKLSRLSPATDTATPIRVLVVDDSLAVRQRLREQISLLENVTLLEAGTLAEARVLLEAQAGELFCAVLDLTLPDASGLDVVEAVRAYKVPSIVLTSSAHSPLRQAVLDLRVVDYILKTEAGAIEDVAYLIGRLRQNMSMTVLVVDDSQVFRQHLTSLLGQYRFVTMTAGNGREALALLEQHPEIALILTDHHMPEMEGLEMIRRIRRTHRREDLAIIALSDLQRPALSAAMLKAGANDYLNKGFQVEEFYCRVVQNANMVRYVRELRDMAHRDHLTRLYNRRYLFRTAETLHAQARAGRRHLALAMVDADHFKRINDVHGHDAGDLALQRIAAVLRQGMAGKGLAARYGGEEFVCALPLDDPARAEEQFEALRAAISAIELHWQGVRIPLTVSIGLTIQAGHSLTDMISRADQALYQAKTAGRNRLAVDPAPPADA